MQSGFGLALPAKPPTMLRSSVPFIPSGPTALLALGLAALTALLDPSALAAQPAQAPDEGALAGGRLGRADRLHRSGQALVAAGHWVSAMSYFRRAIQVDPSFASAYVDLAEIYLAREGGDRDALEVIEVGRRRRADHVPLGLLHARVLEEQGRAEEAAAVLRRLVVRAPRVPAVHSLRATLAARRGAWSEALFSYRALVRLAEDGVDLPEDVREDAARHVAALELLARPVDPVQRDCASSPVRRALCHR